MASPGEVGFFDTIWDFFMDHVVNAFRVVIQGTVTLAGPVEVEQATPDDLNCNANLQVGDADVGPANPVPVGALTVTRASQPSITAGAYVAGDALGGRMDLITVARPGVGTFILESIVIIDDARQGASIDLVLFDRAFTGIADNAPFDPSDADLANCIGVIPITAGEYSLFVDNAIATKRNVGLRLALVPGGTTLFAQMVVRDAPTYAATNDIFVKLFIRQD